MSPTTAGVAVQTQARSLLPLGALLLVLIPAATPAEARAPRAVVFFNPYCESCVKESPLVKPWLRSHARGHRVSGVGFRVTTKAARRWARKMRWRFPVTGDPDGHISRRWNVTEPTTIVLANRRGRRRHYDIRAPGATAAKRKRPRCKRPSRSRTRASRSGTRCKKRPRRPAQRPVAVQPRFISQLSLPLDGQNGWVVLRYAELVQRDPDSSSEDAATLGEFATASARNTNPSLSAIPVLCGQPGQVEPLLQRARITAPVYVVTAADCRAQLNERFAGLTADASGRTRVFRRLDGRPYAGYWSIERDAKKQGLPAEDWLALRDTDVVLANIASAPRFDLRGLERGDTLIQSFWDGCPSCRADEHQYEIQAWADQNPGAQLVAVTCDSAGNAGRWAYQHGWRIPVIAYGGSDWSAECFEQMKERFGLSFYGDHSYLREGKVSTEAACSFRGYPGSSRDC